LSYFAVYDGHAGDLTSTYLENNLHKNIFNKGVRTKFLREDLKDNEIVDVLRKGYQKTEADVVEYIREREDWRFNLLFKFERSITSVYLGMFRIV
jgi:serine/threonine protein phosphatase PrpC